VPSERCSIEEQSIEYCGWACCVHNIYIYDISRLRVKQRFLSPDRPDLLWDPPNPLLNGHRDFSPVVKAAGVSS
jgi:hypothetical protein